MQGQIVFQNHFNPEIKLFGRGQDIIMRKRNFFQEKGKGILMRKKTFRNKRATTFQCGNWTSLL